MKVDIPRKEGLKRLNIPARHKILAKTRANIFTCRKRRALAQVGIQLKTYLVWLDFLAKCGQKPNLLPSLEGFAYAIEKEGIDVSQVLRQIKKKEPSNWSKPVFGNENFAKRILKREGWLPGSVNHQQMETPPPGQGIKSPSP